MVSDGLCQVGGREEKVLNVFKVVQFPNAACNTSTGTSEYKIFEKAVQVNTKYKYK